MRNLKEDILSTFKQFVKDIGRSPKRIIFDFDQKLIGGRVKVFFTDKGCHVEAAPSGRQCQNGLTERNWRTIVRMARSWLTSALLPSTFWWFAIQRASQVTNYLPLKANGHTTTPLELAYGVKPDLRVLFPLFAIGYIRRTRDAQQRQTFQAQSLQCIAVGKSPVADALEFYHPPTKQMITSADFRLDPTVAPGPVFKLPYDGGIFFNQYHNDADRLRPPGFDLQTEVFIVAFDTPKQAIISAVPINDSDLYTVQMVDDGNIHQFPSSQIRDYNPEHPMKDGLPVTPSTPSLPDWIQDGVKVTLFLDDKSTLKQGRLHLHDDNVWHFQPGRRDSNSHIPMPNFLSEIGNFIHDKKLYEGWLSKTQVAASRQTQRLKKIVAHHVSAANLKNLDPPTLINHKKLNPADRAIWDAAYAEEIEGLTNINTWVTIDHSEYE